LRREEDEMSETTTYQPELGQSLFGAPTGEYDLPEYAEALFFGIWREIVRVFCNKNQRDMDSRGADDPGVPGITVRPYWWGDEDAPEASLPNFAFGEAQIRWYKYPGRGMSCNVTWTPDQWVAWFDAAIAAIRAFEDLCDVCGESGCRRSCLEPQVHDDIDSPF
jgi:hypothetical protein